MKWKLLSGCLLGILLISLFTGIVLAQYNPESGVVIMDAFAFRDVLTSGDQLYFVRYCVNYTSVPDYRPYDTWQMALYDNTGNLTRIRPLYYFWENIMSIYLEPDDALTWGAAHQVQISGMPSVYPNLTEGVNLASYNLSVLDYYEGFELGGMMLAQAAQLEINNGWDLLTGANHTGLLNSLGGTLFQFAIPNLVYMVPEIFSSAEAAMDVDYNTDYDTSYSENLRTHEGAQLTAAINSLGGLINVGHDTMAFWLIMVFFICMGGLVFSSGGNPGWALVVGYACLAGAAYLIGGTIFILAAIIPVVLAIIFGILFILGRFA